MKCLVNGLIMALFTQYYAAIFRKLTQSDGVQFFESISSGVLHINWEISWSVSDVNFIYINWWRCRALTWTNQIVLWQLFTPLPNSSFPSKPRILSSRKHPLIVGQHVFACKFTKIWRKGSLLKRLKPSGFNADPWLRGGPSFRPAEQYLRRQAHFWVQQKKNLGISQLTPCQLSTVSWKWKQILRYFFTRKKMIFEPSFPVSKRKI